jgi:acyl-CoA dehydrogenase
MYSAPSDTLAQEITGLVSRPTGTRERLCGGIFAAAPSPLAELQRALQLAEELRPLESRLKDAVRAGLLPGGDVYQRGPEALARGLISAEDAARLEELDALVQSLVAVDDFDPADLRRPSAA